MKDEIEQDYMAILISKKNIFSILLFLISYFISSDIYDIHFK